MGNFDQLFGKRGKVRTLERPCGNAPKIVYVGLDDVARILAFSFAVKKLLIKND